MRLLVAEDDPKLLKTLIRILQTDHHTVDGVENGEDALHYVRTGEYDGLVLDIMMPGLDGISLLKKLRNEGMTLPALFLSARSEVESRVEGLDAGADDYLAKPFSTSELLARVRAMLRRKAQYTPDMLCFGALTLNRSTYELGFEGRTASLSGKELAIMEMLLDRPHMILTVEQIMNHIWNFNSDADISVVWVHVSNIRKKLAQLNAPYEIRFVRSAGYLLCEKEEKEGL